MLNNMELIEVPHDQGTIAVEVSGDGALVVCVPGMGESRGSFRHLTPGLVAAGFRVATMDLRGHGDSSTTFDTYDDVAVASDIAAVIDALGGGPATIVGNSMGAGAAVIAAARHPQSIDRLVLIGPFVRDHGSPAMRVVLGAVMRLALAKPWGPKVWAMYYSSLFGEDVMADHDDYVASTLKLLRRPGRWRAFQATTRTSHAPAEAALSKVSSPVLVVMGDRDRDFSNPENEAAWVAESLRGNYHMIAGAGHYPMAEQPEPVLSAMLSFFDSTSTLEQ